MPRLTKVEKAAINAKNAARLAEARRIVTSGVCPQCGAGVRRNLALTGWYQCKQFGSDGFRENSSKPSCSWQTFTE